MAEEDSASPGPGPGAPGQEDRVRRAVDRALMPTLFAMATVCYLDRTNISFAALQMNRDLGFTPEVYAIGTAIFFIGYTAFEVPSNMVLHRVGAPRWLARIMVTWGIAAGLMALVNGPASFYLMRFLLGVAEAGAYPGICYYLTAWYSEAQYGVAYSYIPTGSAFSGVIGGALAALILQLDDVAGLPGWRWLFVVEGIIPVALGLALPRLLPLGPADAKFLAPADAAWLSKRQAREQQLRQTTSAAAEGRPWDAVRAAARNRRVWWCLAIWLTLTCSYYGILFFGPLIIQQVLNPNCRISDTGARDEHCPSKVDVRILLLSSVPYVAAIAAMTLNARHSRRTRERKLHMAVPMSFAIAGLVLAPLLGAYPALGFLAVIVATAGVWAVYGPMSELWGELDSGAAHAASFAIVNGGGNLGGLFGPLIIGSLTTSSGDFTAPFFLLAALMGVSAILVLAFPERRDARALRGAASVASVDAEVISEGAILLDTVADPVDAT